MTKDVPREWPLRQALQVAQAVLDGKLGPIEGSRTLAGYAHDIVPDWSIDTEFVVFGAVASETDDFPFGESRRFWSAAALAESDARLDAYTNAVASDVRAACVGLISRFKDSPTFP